MPYKLPKTMLIFSMVTCVLIRVWIKLTMVNPSSGFYTNDSPVILFFNILLGISAVALLVLCVMQKPVPDMCLHVPRDAIMVRLSSILCGVGAFVAAAGGAFEQYEIYVDEVNWGGILNSDQMLFFARTAGGFFLFSLLPLVAGLILLISGLRPQFRPCPIVALSLPVWQLGLSIVLFLRFTTLRSVSDQQLGLVTLISVLPFALAWARVYCEIDYARGMRQLMLFGFVAALFALMIPTGMLAGAVAGRPVQVALPLPLCVFQVTLALYMIALLFSVELVPQPSSCAPSDETAQLPDPPSDELPE